MPFELDKLAAAAIARKNAARISLNKARRDDRQCAFELAGVKAARENGGSVPVTFFRNKSQRINAVIPAYMPLNMPLTIRQKLHKHFSGSNYAQNSASVALQIGEKPASVRSALSRYPEFTCNYAHSCDSTQTRRALWTF
jgi:hypothetical protein